MVFSKKTKITILCILLALTLAFIWGNSLLPSTESQKLSDAVKEVLEQVLPENFFSGSGEGGTFVRKLAHFTEFTVLGAELSMLLWAILNRSLTAPLLCGLLAAVTDETIQIFIEGRGSSVRDVWIDFGGVAAGTLFIFLFRHAQTRRRTRPRTAAHKRMQRRKS